VRVSGDWRLDRPDCVGTDSKLETGGKRHGS
jgi:hypothetical protein